MLELVESTHWLEVFRHIVNGENIAANVKNHAK